MIELTPEQLAALLRGELELGKVSSVYEPDGIFSSIEEKRQIIEWLNNEENRIRNQ
jgi:hypothetical protein